jgi:putative MATE family efflux protein
MQKQDQEQDQHQKQALEQASKQDPAYKSESIDDNEHEMHDAQDKTKRMGSEPIPKLLAQFSIPAVIAMLVNAIYNIVDRIFIGKFVGEDALAGLTISFPVMMIIFAFAGLVGIGSSALMSIHLGKRDFKGVNQIFGNMITFGTLVTGATLSIIFINLDGIMNLFGATPDIINYASDYMRIILMGFIFQMYAFCLNGAVRTEGHPMLSMTTMLLSAITNIILDYVFIVNLGWGVQGAAIATITGQLTGLLFLLRFYLSGNSVVKLQPHDFIPRLSVFKSITSIGVSSFVTQLGTSVAMTFLNRGLGQYGGVGAITSMGAINSLFTLFIMPMIGLQQGLQPIIGYNHGAKSFDRVKGALKLGLTVSMLFSTVIFIALQVFPRVFISAFLDPTSETVDVAVTGLRIFILMLPFLGINILGTGFFQSIAKGHIAIMLGAMRQFIFLLPLVIILPQFFGLTGVWMATPIADAISILATAIALLYHFKETPSLAQEA